EKLSDLTPMARRLSFGGPPESAQRPLCLEGLEDVYKLQFAHFEPMPSRDVTAAALGTGEIDVGMIDTTDPNLLKPGADLVQLADDKRLQPADNVVPVVRREIVDAYGPPPVRLGAPRAAQPSRPPPPHSPPPRPRPWCGWSTRSRPSPRPPP